MRYHCTRENGQEKYVHMFEFGDAELRILYDLASRAHGMTPECLETQTFRQRLRNMTKEMSAVIGKRLRTPPYHSKAAREARQASKTEFAKEMGLIPADMTVVGGPTPRRKKPAAKTATPIAVTDCPLERMGKECDPQDEACVPHLDNDRDFPHDESVCAAYCGRGCAQWVERNKK